MRRLNYNHLYFFHVAAEEHGLSKAAQRLGMAQSTLSGHLRSLEQALRTRLFVRHSSGLALTESGRVAFKHTEVMFRAAAQLDQDLLGEADEPIAVVVGVASTVSRSLASDVFVPLFQQPNFRVRLRHGDHDYLCKLMLSGEMDVLVSDVIPTAGENRGIGYRRLQAPRLVAVAAPSLAAKVRRFPEDLNRMPYVGYTLHSRYRMEIDRYFDELDIAPDYLGELDDVVVMLRLAEKAECFAILPDIVFEGADTPCEVLGHVDGLSSDVFVLFMNGQPTKAVARVLELLGAIEG